MNTLEALLGIYGLSTLLEQNDIEEVTVLELLISKGLFNPDDYIYDDVEVSDDD